LRDAIIAIARRDSRRMDERSGAQGTQGIATGAAGAHRYGGKTMASGLVPFARIVDLQGNGPFQLARMKGVLSFGDGQPEWPTLHLETVHGQEVLIPLAAEAVNTLKLYIQQWLRLPGNPVSE
jgi:hypothetical protein